MWTSLVNDAYISLTTHFISGEWNMELVCLGTMPVSERHTGDNISSWIEEILGNLTSVHKRLLALFMTMGQILFVLEKCYQRSLGGQEC